MATAVQPNRRTSAAPIADSTTNSTSFANEFAMNANVPVSPLAMYPHASAALRIACPISSPRSRPSAGVNGDREVEYLPSLTASFVSVLTAAPTLPAVT